LLGATKDPGAAAAKADSAISAAAGALGQLGDLDLGNPYDDDVDSSKAVGAAVDELAKHKLDEAKTFKMSGKSGWLGGGVQITAEIVEHSDPRIAQDPERKAFTDAMEAQGKTVRWVAFGGALDGQGGVQEPDHPAGAGADARIGFSGDQLLEYRSLVPYVDVELGTIEPENQAPPATPEAALAKPRGAEYQLRGKTELKGKGDAGFGWDFGTAAAFYIGVDGHAAHTAKIDVDVERLDGDKVRVKLKKLRNDVAGADFTARISAKIPNPGVIAGVGAVIGTLAQDPKLLDGIANAGDVLSVGFTAGGTVSDDEDANLELTLDLSTDEGKACYSNLAKGNASDALDQAFAARKAGQSGIVLGKSVEDTSHTVEDHAEVALFGKKLFLVQSLRQDRTRIVASNGDVTRADASTFKEHSENLPGEIRDVSWDAVRVVTDATAPDGQGYFRVSFSDHDPLTSMDDFNLRRNLALELNAVPADPVVAKKTDSWWKNLIGAGLGTTETKIDVFFTNDGIQKLHESSGDDTLKAYGLALANLRRNGLAPWALPNSSRAQTAARFYAFLDLPITSSDQFVEQEEAARRQYQDKFPGRDLLSDYGDFKNAQKLMALLDRIRSSSDPKDWNKAFADLGQASGFDFYAPLATLAQIAGDGEVLVHRLEMKGETVDLVMKDQGLVNLPDV
jgi:hypothetical protein